MGFEITNLKTGKKARINNKRAYLMFDTKLLEELEFNATDVWEEDYGICKI